jgi:CMP-N,N'-diacetyllegionaminic acid synthase
MKTLGLIPARGGSKGIKNKNIKIINGKPLIAYTIEQALNSNIDRVIVASDDENIIKVAKKYGAECPFIRPKKISKSKSHAFEIYKYTIDWLKKNENYTPDILCVMLCTTPFRKIKTINSSLKKLKTKKFDWVFSINEMEHHPYRAMVKKNEVVKSFFDIPNNKIWLNRQELPEMYRFNGGVFATFVENIVNHKEYNIDNLKFKKTRVGYEIMTKKEAIDIDDPIDLEFVKFLMKKNGSKS